MDFFFPAQRKKNFSEKCDALRANIHIYAHHNAVREEPKSQLQSLKLK